jgi:hypothetical protein
MKNADGSLLKKAFADSAILQTIGRTKEEKQLSAMKRLMDLQSHWQAAERSR